MANSKMEVDIVMKSSGEKVWKNLKDFPTIFPKVLSHTYESIKIVQGGGICVGSVLNTTFKPPVLEGGVPNSVSSRMVLFDEEKKTFAYAYLEADVLLKHYKNFKATICVTTQAGIEDGCVVKFSAEFDKENQQIPDPIFYRDFIVKVFQDLDAYLIIE